MELKLQKESPWKFPHINMMHIILKQRRKSSAITSIFKKNSYYQISLDYLESFEIDLYINLLDTRLHYLLIVPEFLLVFAPFS